MWKSEVFELSDNHVSCKQIALNSYPLLFNCCTLMFIWSNLALRDWQFTLRILKQLDLFMKKNVDYDRHDMTSVA